MRAKSYEEIIASRSEFHKLAKHAIDPKSSLVQELLAKLKSVNLEDCTPYLMKLIAPLIE